MNPVHLDSKGGEDMKGARGEKRMEETFHKLFVPPRKPIRKKKVKQNSKKGSCNNRGTKLSRAEGAWEGT